MAAAGITDDQARQMAKGLAVTGDLQAAADQIKGLYKLFEACDCTMVEVRGAAAVMFELTAEAAQGGGAWARAKQCGVPQTCLLRAGACELVPHAASKTASKTAGEAILHVSITMLTGTRRFAHLCCNLCKLPAAGEPPC